MLNFSHENGKIFRAILTVIWRHHETLRIYQCPWYMFDMATQIWGGSHWLPLYMHVPIWEQPSIPRKSSEKRKNFIISLALFDLSESVSSSCPPKWRWTHGRKSRVGVAWGWGGCYTPSRKNNFAQTRKKVKNFILVSSQIFPTKWG